MKRDGDVKDTTKSKKNTVQLSDNVVKMEIDFGKPIFVLECLEKFIPNIRSQWCMHLRSYGYQIQVAKALKLKA